MHELPCIQIGEVINDSSFSMARLRMLLLFSLLSMAAANYSSADASLENPDFETPPTNMAVANSSSTTAVLLTGGDNTIPGWFYNGTVWYLSSSPNYSFPRNGHAIILGKDGRINQTFRANKDYLDYVLSFTLGTDHRTTESCYNNSVAVNVSVPGRSKVFSFRSSYLGRKTWESYAFYMGPWIGVNEFINLEIESVVTNEQPSVTCWPVVDSFAIQRNEMPKGYSGNMLVNSDFEVGPAFIKNSTEGILLDDEPDELESPLQQWAISGIVRYIDYKHYSVPEGKAAIELISGAQSGISMEAFLARKSKYTLEFIMGDANDSCVADFVVNAQVGTFAQNFTMQSSGNGSYHNCSMAFVFREGIGRVTVGVASLKESRTSSSVLCGPVIDNVILRPSAGVKVQLCIEVIVFCLILIVFF